MKGERRWCAWCGDDLDPDAAHFLPQKCERDFWRDVYRTNEDPSTVAASLRARVEEIAT